MRNRDDFVAVVQDRALVWRRIAYLICGDWIRAEDLVQQALLRMYVRWNHIERATVDAYARKVITRLAIDESRRPYRRSEVSGELPEIPVAEVNVADILAVRAALQQVPPRQRAAVVLRYYHGLSVAETAAALGVTQGTVKSQTARGLSTMRAELEDGDVLDPASSESIEVKK